MTEWQPSPKDLETLAEWWRTEKAQVRAQAQAQIVEILEADEKDLDAVVAKQRQAGEHARAFRQWADEFEDLTEKKRALEEAGRRQPDSTARGRLRNQLEAVSAERQRLAREFQSMAATNPVASAALDYLRDELDAE